jgi:drug/metabolite transporter (DMT)-like permease
MKPRLQDYLTLHLLVFLWGFTSLLGVLLKPLSATEVVFWRTLLAAALMWVLFGARYFRNPLTRKAVFAILGAGLVIGLHWYLFFLAARVGNVSSCLAGIATGSVWTAFLEPAFEKRRAKLRDLLTALVVMGGMLFIFSGDADKVWGVVVGIASAFFTALFGILNRRFVQAGLDVYAVATWGITGAFLSSVLLMPIAVLVGIQATWIPALPDDTHWLWLALLSGVCTVFALTVSVSLGKRFTAFASSLAVNLEPVYGIIVARLVLGTSEYMSTNFYLGTALILMAVLGHTVLAQKENPPLPEITGA